MVAGPPLLPHFRKMLWGFGWWPLTPVAVWKAPEPTGFADDSWGFLKVTLVVSVFFAHLSRGCVSVLILATVFPSPLGP